MRRRAIILDDNSTLRKVLWTLLDSRGYEVFTFPDPGLCPLHVVQQCPCPPATSCADVIISDVNMLEANGLDFLEQLIQKGCKQQHYALMSGSFSEADRARASLVGCALFSKPLDIAQLIAWIEQVEQSIPLERTLFDWHKMPAPQESPSRADGSHPDPSTQ